MASAVEIELASPISALPPSRPRTLAMPAPGNPCTLGPGMAFSNRSLNWPPSGIHDPPCGPVIILKSAAAAGAATVRARPNAKPKFLLEVFLAFVSSTPVASRAGHCDHLGWRFLFPSWQPYLAGGGSHKRI